jgi:DNA polymerase-3 subunit delta
MSVPNDVYLIYGDDEFLVEEGLVKVLAAIRSKGYEDLTVETIDCKEQGTSEVMAEIASPTLFSTNKATVLRRFQLTGRDKLAKELERRTAAGLAPGQFIILMPDKVDKRLKIVREIGKKHGVLELNTLDHEGLVDWIVARFRGEGKSASADVAESLLDLKGEEDPKGQVMRALDSEIEKLVVYSGDAGEVTQDDVDAVVGRSRTERVFELVERVLLREVGKALDTLNDLLEGGESAIGIVLRLSREIRSLIQIHLFLKSERMRWDPSMSFPAFRSGVLAAFKIWVEERGIPPEATCLRQHPYAAFQKFRKGGDFQLDDLVRLLDRLLEANQALVSTSKKPKVVLEQVVTTLGV